MGKKNERIYCLSEPRPVGGESAFGKRTFFSRELDKSIRLNRGSKVPGICEGERFGNCAGFFLTCFDREAVSKGWLEGEVGREGDYL